MCHVGVYIAIIISIIIIAIIAIIVDFSFISSSKQI